MPTQIESAAFASIGSLDTSYIGRKLRLVGRLLSYDALNGRVLLLDVDGKHTIIIDAQEVLDEASDKWANERLCTLIVMGYVEESLNEVPAFDAKIFARGIQRPPSKLQLKAILVLPGDDLDLKLWAAVLDASEHTAS